MLCAQEAGGPIFPSDSSAAQWRASTPAGPATGGAAPRAVVEPLPPVVEPQPSGWRAAGEATATPAVAPPPAAPGSPGPTAAPVSLLPPVYPAPRTPWYEGFEGPQPSWRTAGGDAQFRIEAQQRVTGEAHSGQRSEWLRIVAHGGASVYVSHDIGAAEIIDELAPTVWVKSDRAGIQLLAEVVFPRAKHPRTGRTLFTLLSGSSYSHVGGWQQLRLDDVPRALARQVRVLRAELGPQIDDRGAYLRRVVLNIYGGPGATNVWIDDLDVLGYVARSGGPDAEEDRPTVTARSDANPFQLAGQTTATAANDAPAERRPAATVQLSGATLLVDGRPLFPRIIRYRGEPLDFLARLGFNAVQIDQPPSPELLREAQRTSMWIVAPPPNVLGSRDGGPPAEISAAYNRVLAWDLGHGLFHDQLDATGQLAEHLRMASRQCPRPMVGEPESDLKQYSRYLDLLLMGRRPAGTSLELTDYGTWIRNRPLLARPGTPIWTTVQTQLSPAVGQQLRILEPDRDPPSSIAAEQVLLLAYTAITAGSRGLLFESESPLSADDLETRQRAMALELTNLELSLIEPWLAAGTLVNTVGGSSPEIVGATLRLDRARLLMPLWSAPGAQLAPGQSAGHNVTLVVPGVPESTTAYELLPGGLRPLKHKRVVGGTQVTLDEFGLAALVLLAQDPAVISNMAAQTTRIGARAAELQRLLAAAKMQNIDQVTASLGRRVPAPRQAHEWSTLARQQLQAADQQLTAKDYQSAYLSAQRAVRAMRLIERGYWETAVAKLPSPLVSPAALAFATLPWQQRVSERIATAKAGPNLLPAGDFEDLPQAQRAGWQHFRHPTESVVSAAEMLPGMGRSGRMGLRLSAKPADPQNPPALVETPPLWIVSPAVPVQAGDLVCIQGWVQIPAALTGTVDGLMVFDSLGGDAMAQRFGRTSTWKQFTFYRPVVRSGPLSITIALTGLGEARVDDLTVQVLEPGAAKAALALPNPLKFFQR